MALKWEIMEQYLKGDEKAIKMVEKILDENYENYYLKFFEKNESMNNGVRSTKDITRKVEKVLSNQKLKAELNEEAEVLIKVADELY